MSVKSIQQKLAQVDYPIHEIIQARYSPRAFDPCPIEREHILSLFEAARWTASSRNGQPWRFIVATKDDSNAWDKLFSVLKESNQTWAKNAYLLMVGATYHSNPDNPDFNAQHDLGQAVATMTLQATALGLGVRQMGGIYRDKARDLYQIPDDYQVMNGIAVGHIAALDTLSEEAAARESTPRQRNPLATFIFGEWGQTSGLIE